MQSSEALCFGGVLPERQQGLDLVVFSAVDTIHRQSLDAVVSKVGFDFQNKWKLIRRVAVVGNEGEERLQNHHIPVVYIHVKAGTGQASAE